MAEALGLTAEQQAAIARIRTNAREKTAPLAGELRVAARNLHREIVAAPGDTDAVKALPERVSTLRQQIADARLEARIATAALLTDEQRAKLPTAMGPRAGNRLGARFGRGPGRVGPEGEGPGFEGPRHGPRGGGPRGARGPAAGA
jgi:Spy/CpxP family protein refolding chaperone